MINGERLIGLQRIEPEDMIVLPGGWKIVLSKKEIDKTWGRMGGIPLDFSKTEIGDE